VDLSSPTEKDENIGETKIKCENFRQKENPLLNFFVYGERGGKRGRGSRVVREGSGN